MPGLARYKYGDKRRYSRSCPEHLCHRVDIVNLNNTHDSTSSKETKLYRHILTLRNEIEKIGSKFKYAGTHIKESYDVLKMRMSPSKDFEQDGCGSARTIQIEYNDLLTLKRHRKSKHFDDFEDSEQDYDVQKNFSPLLSLHPLREGKFGADISLDNFPSNDDIIVRVCDYKLEIFTQKRQTSKKNSKTSRNSRPVKCGEINLPIFVDPRTLEIKVDDNNLLTLSANMKGHISIKSLSSENLSIDFSHKHMKKPPMLRRSTHLAIVKMPIPRSNTVWYVEDDTLITH